VPADELSDNSAECVVCLSDVRDTLILPCRHLCLCNACADTLRYQANNCPICRLPFRALLQIRAMRKKQDPLTPSGYNPIITSQIAETDDHSASDHIPVGYEVVSLLEALNGPLTPTPSAPPIHQVRNSVTPSPLPTIGPNGQTLPVRTLAPPDRVCDNSNPGFKLKKSSSKSVSRSSSILHGEDEVKSFSDGEIVSPTTHANQEVEDLSATPESENVTLSSSGAVDQSSCTGTPLSSTITSPEGWWLAAVTALVCDNNNEEPSPVRLDNDPCLEDAVPGTGLTDDPLHHPLSLPANSELKESGDSSHIYGPLIV
ncbi:E3 ubiquitin ligase RNF157-like, partial [Rhincodon typus]|uniref:E3 ubiquitin ligase RNF157-like n=1 Tax=Rhincodon typus TaxID=259920 RepID=UPI00202E82F7